MTDLRSTIQALAADFASGVLAALREASLHDVLAETSAKPAGAPAPTVTATARSVGLSPAKPSRAGAKRVRRSASEIEQVVERVASTLRAHKGGLRSEQLQKVMNVSKAQLLGPLAEALKTGQIKKKGQRRATTYFVS